MGLVGFREGFIGSLCELSEVSTGFASLLGGFRVLSKGYRRVFTGFRIVELSDLGSRAGPEGSLDCGVLLIVV